MRILTACASALALAISVPALSQGQGNGNDRGGGPQAERGQGHGHSNAHPGNRGASAQDDRHRVDSDRGNRGNGNAERGNGPPQQRADRGPDSGRAGRGNDDRPARAENRGGGNSGRSAGNRRDFVEARTRNLRDAAERAANRQRLVELRDHPGERRGQSRDFDNDFYRERRWTDAVFRDRLVRVRDRQRTAWQGRFCPPGLANKNELCMPPGQYRKLYNYGGRFDRSGFGLPDWYRSSYGRDPFYGMLGSAFDYRYANGYAYRVDPETQLIAALLPVLGGALGLGQTLPVGYNVYNLPMQYRPVYADDSYYYRYGDGAIYRVDPRNRTILGISELLTPGFTVGQPLPAGYGVYNVPYGYRDTYYDTDDYLYRYNNGRIYQVDPETRLVLAAIDLLT